MENILLPNQHDSKDLPSLLSPGTALSNCSSFLICHRLVSSYGSLLLMLLLLMLLFVFFSPEYGMKCYDNMVMMMMMMMVMVMVMMMMMMM